MSQHFESVNSFIMLLAVLNVRSNLYKYMFNSILDTRIFTKLITYIV